MSCCGQKRRAMQAPRPAPPAPQPPALQNPILLSQTGSFPLVVRGPVSGHTYLFAPAGTPLTVDERDAKSLLQSNRFVLWPA